MGHHGRKTRTFPLSMFDMPSCAVVPIFLIDNTNFMPRRNSNVVMDVIETFTY